MVSNESTIQQAHANGNWNALTRVFDALLQRGAYTLESKETLLSLLKTYVIPELGAEVFPSETRTLPHTQPQFRSFMTDDHTPLEFSWKFNKSGRAAVRFTMDPVLRQLLPDEHGPFKLFQDLGNSGIFSAGFDLSWCQVCADTLVCSTFKAQELEIVPGITYPSQYFAGFEFGQDATTLKAYFLPQVRSVITSTSKEKLITKAIKAISDLETKPKVDILTPWNQILSFFGSLPPHLVPELKFVAVDCVLPHQNRFKVYAETPVASLSNLRRFFLFGCADSDIPETMQKALSQISLLWSLLYPEADNETQISSHHKDHPNAGLLFYYELRDAETRPVPKVYLPVQYLCRNDQDIANALGKFYRETGLLKLGENYGRDLGGIFNHRPLDSRVGIQTYISLGIKKGEIEVTTYLNPECYAPERQIATTN